MKVTVKFTPVPLSVSGSVSVIGFVSLSVFKTAGDGFSLGPVSVSLRPL